MQKSQKKSLISAGQRDSIINSIAMEHWVKGHNVLFLYAKEEERILECKKKRRNYRLQCRYLLHLFWRSL